jgi:transketolase C-terminal domain/subunit
MRSDIEQAVPQIAAHQGPVYMRLLRGNVPLVLDEYNYRFGWVRPSCCAMAPMCW